MDTLSSQSPNGFARLLLASAALVAVWCVVLPAVGRIRAVQQHVDALDARNIDASAMFYTELESFEPWLDHLEGRDKETS